MRGTQIKGETLHFQVKKVIKTTTTRTVIPSVSDTLSLDGGGSVTGVGGYTTPMGFRQGPGAAVPMDYPTNTVPRNYHYGPPVGYNDYRAGPPPDAYASLNRSAHMDDRYRFVEAHLCLPHVCGAVRENQLTADCISPCRPVHPVHPDGYRTLDPNYRAHSRGQLDPYAAQPQVASSASACVHALILWWFSDTE